MQVHLPCVGDSIGEVLYSTCNVGHGRVKEAIGEKLVDGGERLPRDGSGDAFGPYDVQEGRQKFVGINLVEGEGRSQHALQVQERLQESRVERIRGPLTKSY